MYCLRRDFDDFIDIKIRMILKHLSLTNYKNIEDASLDFSSKLNCIIGSNGMGKTNLLDSIYYLSNTRSHVFLPDSMLIRHGADMAVINGQYLMHEKEEVVFCGLRQGKPKSLRRNKKSYNKISDHIGLFPLVMIAPSDMDLIKGGSAERRKFMDMIISQESNPYLMASINYQRLLEQRNALLKQSYGLDMSVLEVLNDQMSVEAETITQYRRDWVNRIRPIFMEYYHFISQNKDEVNLNYLPSYDTDDEHEKYSAESFRHQWRTTYQQDKVLGHTSIGPHKDDLEMLISGTLIRKIGSQGQNKTFMVALKVAQFVLLSKLHRDNKPILLLDDVFDKLDEHRVDRIVRLVSGDSFGQIFMTDTNRKYLDQILSRLERKEYCIIKAENGTFEPLEYSNA